MADALTASNEGWIADVRRTLANDMGKLDANTRTMLFATAEGLAEATRRNAELELEITCLQQEIAELQSKTSHRRVP